jgi:hypothetical protein
MCLNMVKMNCNVDLHLTVRSSARFMHVAVQYVVPEQAASGRYCQKHCQLASYQLLKSLLLLVRRMLDSYRRRHVRRIKTRVRGKRP